MKFSFDSIPQITHASITFTSSLVSATTTTLNFWVADRNIATSTNIKSNPINRNRTIVSGLTSEQWVYGWGTYLYFDNGKLTAIQD